MPIMSVGEVKTYLGITASTHDAIITLLIPDVQQRVCEICNSSFESDLWISGNFGWSASTNTISIVNASFLTAGFADGDDIYISESYRNDGFHQVSTAAALTLTITSATTIVDELSTSCPIITICKWPRGLKPIVASMIRYDYEVRPTLSGKQSESIGDYSYSAAGASIYGYPDDIMRGLSYWMRPRFG